MGILLKNELGVPCGVEAFLLKIDLQRVAKCDKLIVEDKSKSRNGGIDCDL